MVKLTKRHYLGIGLLGVNLAAISLPFTAAADTQQTTTAVGLTVNAVLSAYSSGPTVTLGAITPDSTGKQSTASDTVSATSNDAAGVTMTLEENSATTTMTSGSDTIAATTGSTGSPVTLTNGKWGWRLDSLAGFGAGPTSVISNAAPSSLTYAAVPTTGSPFTIKTTSSSGSTSATVWYSARVNNTQPSGTYSNTVLYTISTN